MGAFDQTIRQFLEEASSNSPTPGGGSMAALSAALGASMGAMVANFTTGPKFEAVQNQMTVIVEQMKMAIDDFEKFSKQDMDSFNEYLTALGMPKSSNEEKRARSLALQEAAAHSIDVPLNLIRRCLETMTILEEATDKVNKKVISDLGIAIITLEAAIQSAWITVEINLGSIKNDELRKSYQDAGTELLSRTQEIKLNVLQRVREKIFFNAHLIKAICGGKRIMPKAKRNHTIFINRNRRALCSIFTL